MGKRSPGPMSYIREASALRNIKLCYAGRSFSIRVVSRCVLFQYVLLFGAYRYAVLTDDQKARRQDHSWHRALLSLGN